MTAADATLVVVGAGEAGGTAVQVLRDEGFDGRLVLVGGEDHLPYERPALSKGYLNGDPYTSEGSLVDQKWYDDQHVELQLGRRAVSVDRSLHQVALDDGTTLHYDKLLVATGATPRRLDVPGGDLDGIHYLRTLEDSESLAAALKKTPRVVVVGAGWIGLEAAAVARGKGCAVTVIEPNAVPLEAAMGERIGTFFADLHRQHGVEFSFGRGVTGFRGTDRVEAVTTDDGSTVPADVVIVGGGALA
jgi:3-phenylpropionate/trans-cinnamate dioxygenase ferredoxin reductase component